MKKILSTIRFAFSRPSSPVSSDQLALLECEIDRGIVERFWTCGEYVTAEDLEKEYQRIKHLKFGNA